MTLRLIVGVGSGYDINARLLARHMAAHILGQPIIIVQNQPGAGSLTMANALYYTGPFDGTVMGASFNGMPTTSLLQPSGIRFDPTKLNWLGSTNRETQVMHVWHTAPAKVLEDARKKEIVIGAQAPGSIQFDYPVLANKLFGFKFKVVIGYESTPKIHLAMESGEVHGTIANWSTLKANQRELDQREQNPPARAMGAAEELRARRCSASPRPTPSATRCGSCWRAWNTAVLSSCRPTYRRRGSNRYVAPSTPR
jgi:tripartite-type tricarboxylate transporter receptor subunit TctC